MYRGGRNIPRRRWNKIYLALGTLIGVFVLYKLLPDAEVTNRKSISGMYDEKLQASKTRALEAKINIAANPGNISINGRHSASKDLGGTLTKYNIPSNDKTKAGSDFKSEDPNIEKYHKATPEDDVNKTKPNSDEAKAIVASMDIEKQEKTKNVSTPTIVLNKNADKSKNSTTSPQNEKSGNDTIDVVAYKVMQNSSAVNNTRDMKEAPFVDNKKATSRKSEDKLVNVHSNHAQDMRRDTAEKQ